MEPPVRLETTNKMIRLKELHFKMQDKEYLSSFEKNLNEHLKKELFPWWTIMQNIQEELQ